MIPSLSLSAPSNNASQVSSGASSGNGSQLGIASFPEGPDNTAKYAMIAAGVLVAVVVLLKVAKQ